MRSANLAVEKAIHERFVSKRDMADPDSVVRRVLREAFVNRKWLPGQVKFSKSSFDDPHIKRVIAAIAKKTGILEQEIISGINAELDKFRPLEAKAPILYATIKDNIIEDTVFKAFLKSNVETGAPKFSVRVFNALMLAIRADHDEFFPLRSFIDHKHLYNPNIAFVGTGHEDIRKYGGGEEGVTTAAAHPAGIFIFNVDFMQSLMDYSHLKGVRPKGRKYVSNGGEIPDEYGYIEFIIIHEFMHYTNDDFYYQKIIPNANPDIINWTGDFRTNYLLVKSGYEQLPMGLFNDHINYDRQKTYVEMYRLVESEFEKLNDKEKKDISDKLDEMGDDHKPGQEGGKQSKTAEGGKDAQGNKIDPSKIDEKARKTEGQMKGSGDKSSEEGRERSQSGEGKDTGAAGAGGPSASTRAEDDQTIDYTRIRPAFNWAALTKRFISSAKPRTEETYQKPSRRGVSGVHIAAQIGAAAIKPGEVETEYNEIGLCFIVDSSGSMTAEIEKVYANIHALLRQPQFIKSLFTLIKFSGGFKIFKCNFPKNIAGEVEDVLEKPKQFKEKISILFNKHIGDATNFSEALVIQAGKLIKLKHNILIFSDADMLAGTNITHLLQLIKAAPHNVFVLFDSRASYIKFRETAKMSTPNISYID